MKAEILITDSLVVKKAALFGAAFLPEINAAYLNTASLTEKLFTLSGILINEGINAIIVKKYMR